MKAPVRPRRSGPRIASILVGVLLALLMVAGAGAQEAGKHWELTEHQKGIPGPQKREMAQADYSGTVNADPQWIADRLAILNHMTAYSYLIDEGRWDQWYELFAPDVTIGEHGSLLRQH
jgi:hypothetical protein